MLIVDRVAGNIVERVFEGLLADCAHSLAYLMTGGGDIAVNIALLAAGAGMRGVAFFGAGRRGHDGVVSVYAKIAVSLAALVAYRFIRAVGLSAAVSLLCTELIPALVYDNAVFLKLGSEILKRLAAALAAKPVGLIIVAVVDILDFDLGKKAVNGDILNRGKITVLYHIGNILCCDVEVLEQVCNIYRAYRVLARVQIMARAGLNNTGIVRGYGRFFIQVEIAALFAYIVRLYSVLGAGLFNRRDKFEMGRAAVSAGGIVAPAVLDDLAAA